ncbi:hypothetical protein QO014_002124 [Kaistia dalseonensis]|uniref:DUF2867 domain-containing protein n=1 Tax=Kaistia dalseonensis TaxID=410840 RepID=A0ABU0H606_9HYPH|nr:hypothetical protein [Kaistia dalseonensis]MDQ0437732.1 hypothetical protein [Kaistia dalseonensis]
MLDDYLPDYDFSERHCRNVAARPDTIIEAASAYRAESDPFFRAMIGVREIPMRLAGWLGGRRAGLPPTFSLDNFTLLDRRDGSELVYGLVGQFWRSDFGLVSIADGTAFRAFDRPGIAKLVLGFSTEPGAGGLTKLTTETRIFCPDPVSRRKFAPYWYLIRPVSGLIRGRVLTSIRRASEKREAARR